MLSYFLTCMLYIYIYIYILIHISITPIIKMKFEVYLKNKIRKTYKPSTN